MSVWPELGFCLMFAPSVTVFARHTEIVFRFDGSRVSMGGSCMPNFPASTFMIRGTEGKKDRLEAPSQGKRSTQKAMSNGRPCSLFHHPLIHIMCSNTNATVPYFFIVQATHSLCPLSLSLPLFSFCSILLFYLVSSSFLNLAYTTHG